MSTRKISKRPAGCISIPIEVLPKATTTTKTTPRFHSDFSYSPPPLRQPSTKTFRRPLNNQPPQGFRMNSDFIQSFVPQSDFFVERFPTTPQDRSHSPGSQRDESASSSPQESDFKKAKDATGSDQQVPTTENPIRDPNVVALEKLEQVKQNLIELNEQVDAFTGSTRDDRIYRGLDEQALKMMLLCDELVDVSAEIKEKRKEMIQNVQTIVAKLESKVPITQPIESNSNENILQIYEPNIDTLAST